MPSTTASSSATAPTRWPTRRRLCLISSRTPTNRHPHRRTAAHLQRDHRRQEKPSRQRHLRPRLRQPGRHGGVWRPCHRRHPRQEEQDHQLRRLCLGEFPGAGTGTGRPSGAVCAFALAHRPCGVWPLAQPPRLSAQADSRPEPRFDSRHFPPLRLRHRGELRRRRHPPSG